MLSQILKIRSTWIGIVAILFMSIGFNLAQIHKNPSTPFDELAHFDYVDRMSHLDPPKVFDRYSQTTLKVAACSQIKESPAWAGLDKCGSVYYEPTKAPWGGLSSATGFLPTYYFITALPYRGCTSFFSPKGGELTCMRAANSLWLTASSVIFFLALISSRLRTSIAICFSIAPMFIPALLLQGITVNNDAASLFFSILLIYWSWNFNLQKKTVQQQKVGPFIFFIIGAVSFSIKSTVLPALIISSFILTGKLRFNLLKKPNIPEAGYLIAAGASILVNLLLLKLQPVLRGVGGINDMEPVLQTNFNQSIQAIWNSFYWSLNPFQNVPLPSLLNLFANFSGFILTLFVFTQISNTQTEKRSLVIGSRSYEISLETLLISTLLIYGPLQTAVNYLMLGSAFYQSRYSMSMFVSMALVLLIFRKGKLSLILYSLFTLTSVLGAVLML